MGNRSILASIRRRISSLLSGRRFLKNVLLISGGTAISQIILVLSSPILSRLYSPDDFGVLAVYSSILGMIGVVGTLRYEYSVPIEQSDDNAFNALLVSLFIVCASSLAVLALSLLGTDVIVTVFDAEPLRPYLWLLSVGVFGTGTYHALTYWSLRRKNFRTLARTRVNQGIWRSVSQVGLGLTGAGPIGLVIGHIIGQSAGIGTLFRSLRIHDKHLTKSASVQTMVEMSKKYKKFPLVGTWSALMNTAGLQIPVLIMASLFGSEMVGSFSFANRIVAMPLTLIGQAVAQVYFGEGASTASQNPTRLLSLATRSAKRLFLFGLLPAAVLVPFGPWLFSFIFGSVWFEAGIYAQVLSVMLIFRFAVNPISQTLYILERQGLQLLLDTLRVILIVASLYLSWKAGFSPLTAVILYAVCMIAVYIVTYIAIIHALKQRIKESEE